MVFATEAEEQSPANHSHEPVVEAAQPQPRACSRRNLGLNDMWESRSMMRRYLLGTLVLLGLVAASVACMILAKEHMEETSTERDKKTAYTSEFVVFLVLMAYCLIVPICWGVDVWHCHSSCRRRTAAVAVAPTAEPVLLCHPVGDHDDEPREMQMQMQRQSGRMQEQHNQL